MTAIIGFKAPSRRPGALGVHSIGEFVLSVPDLKAAQHFYSSFGLQVEDIGNQLALRTESDGYRWGRVTEGLRKAVHHVAFHCFEDDLQRFKQHIEGQGVKLLDSPPGFDSNGLWFHDHDGKLVEIRVGPKTSPDAKSDESIVVREKLRQSPARSMSHEVHPRRLGHILSFTSDIDRAIEFYSRLLGLRLSDRSGDLIAFMHGVHGSDHHLMAFVKSEGPGLHHLSWDVPTIDAVGMGALAMADKGYSQGWGLGRHVLGSNYFHYIRDPWGSYCEYSCAIDYIPADLEWQDRNYPGIDSAYLWGPEMPPEFSVNTEIICK